jgi:glycine/D-amino acid oxidase-like deaminating enzyme
MHVAPAYDLAIIGGGINGCGIARDAAGRGLAVHLCEMGDLDGGTSSRSTKLIHGGLRYLEYCDFRLVREALREREVLWRLAPHVVPGRCGLCCPTGAASGPHGCFGSAFSSTTIWPGVSCCRPPGSSTSRAIRPVLR